MLYTDKISYKFAVILNFIFLLSVFYTIQRAPEPDVLSKLNDKRVSIKGTIVSPVQLSKSGRSYKFELDVESYKLKNKWDKTKAKTIVYVAKWGCSLLNDSLKLGNRVELRAKVKTPVNATNPGQFDYKKYLESKRIFSISYLSFKDIKSVKPPKTLYWKVLVAINDLRKDILRTHQKFIESPNLEILGSVVFGRYAVPTGEDIRRDFTNSGLIHLLCASGLNVGLIFTIWYAITRRLKLPSDFIIISGGFLVLLYALMTGLPPSIQRATLMLEFVLIGKLIDREADNIALLAMVCCILLLIDPYSLKDIGFQLSFIVTLGLILFMPPLMELISEKINADGRYKTLMLYISALILVPVVALAWVLPLTLFHFNSFAIFSVIANILVVPFMSIICFSGFIASLISLIPLIGQPICGFLDSITNIFVTYLLYISHFFGSAENAVFVLPKPDFNSIILFYVFLLALVYQIKRKFEFKPVNIVLIVLPIIIAVSFIGHNYFKGFNFVFFDVGEGDAIYMHSPNGKNVLVDTGKMGRYNPAKSSIIPYLKSKGITKIDLLVLTHPDVDHIGGAIDIINNIKVLKIIDNGTKADSKYYKKLYAAIARKDIEIETVKNKQKINIDSNLDITVLKPDNTIKSNNNEDSIILLVENNGIKTLLMSDNESNSYKLLKENVGDIDVLKVGHHGSKASLNQQMISLLKPEQAIISVGKNNYGHPSKNILSLLKNNGVRVLRTDKNHALKVKFREGIGLYNYNPILQKWDFCE